MNRIKNYFMTQASRPGLDLASDFFIIGAFVVCAYFGFIH